MLEIHHFNNGRWKMCSEREYAKLPEKEKHQAPSSGLGFVALAAFLAFGLWLLTS